MAKATSFPSVATPPLEMTKAPSESIHPSVTEPPPNTKIEAPSETKNPSVTKAPSVTKQPKERVASRVPPAFLFHHTLLPPPSQDQSPAPEFEGESPQVRQESIMTAQEVLESELGDDDTIPDLNSLETESLAQDIRNSAVPEKKKTDVPIPDQTPAKEDRDSGSLSSLSAEGSATRVKPVVHVSLIQTEKPTEEVVLKELPSKIAQEAEQPGVRKEVPLLEESKAAKPEDSALLVAPKSDGPIATPETAANVTTASFEGAVTSTRAHQSRTFETLVIAIYVCSLALVGVWILHCTRVLASREDALA